MSNDFNYLINESGKGEFTGFLESDKTGKILELLSENNLNILMKSKLKEERIQYILTYSDYKNLLFSNDKMIDALLNTDISYYYATIGVLDKEILKKIITRALNTDQEKAIQIYGYLGEEKQLSLVDLFKPYREYYDKLLKGYPKVVNKVLKEYNIDLLGDEIDIERLFENAKESYLKAVEARYQEREPKEIIEVNPDLLTKDVFNSLFEKYDIYKLRKIIENAAYSVDNAKLNKYLKEKEDNLITSSNNNLSEPFNELYNLINDFCHTKQIETDEEYISLNNKKRQIYKIIYSSGINLPKDIREIEPEEDLEEIYNTLQKYSEMKISDYIIDYHFEENYYNVMLDMQELLNMYYAGNLPLSEEKLTLYQKIFSIDTLSNEEKKELHQSIKDKNMVEMFYDDMAFARKIVGEEIKNASLTKEELKQYEDKDLTEEYGVPVYKIGEEPFFGIIKSGTHAGDYLPTGHSYSLVGNGGLVSFGDHTYLYDANDLNPEQLVHVFPYDSYTLYKPFQSVQSPSGYVNTLMMPDELVETNPNSYNEILILEQGQKSMDMDSKIPALKQIAVYCVDKITNEKVKMAEAKGIGILLIDSKKCTISDNKERGIYRHNIELGYNLDPKYQYFNGFYKKEEYEKNRMQR